jgi:hypothetical protein
MVASSTTAKPKQNREGPVQSSEETLHMIREIRAHPLKQCLGKHYIKQQYSKLLSIEKEMEPQLPVW